MKLTPSILRNFYNALVVCYPFSKWKMPLAAQIDFVVDNDDQIMGSYLFFITSNLDLKPSPSHFLA